MAEVNKLTHRQRQAKQTRGLIVHAARSLFEARGYAETSMEAIAQETGVSPRTVYTVFGTKKALLAAICEAWLLEAGVFDLIAEGMQTPDLRQRLLLVARGSRRQWEVERGTRALLEGAAASDADVARMLAGWKDDRARNWHAIFAGGIELQLKPGVDAALAAALVRALTTSETYSELVKGEGWSPDAYEKWLAGLLISLLLPSSPSSA